MVNGTTACAPARSLSQHELFKLLLLESLPQRLPGRLPAVPGTELPRRPDRVGVAAVAEKAAPPGCRRPRPPARRAERAEAQGCRIKDQKHVWGSCGIDRVVNLNWQLVFAPRTVLEYAVVHELCHLRHRNHDRSFWGLVGTILPDWEARKVWLDQNEHVLTLRRMEPT
jgi:hypothetical protein